MLIISTDKLIYQRTSGEARKKQTQQDHFLVIPKQHIDSAAALTESDAALLGHIYAVIADLCRQLGVAENGYRVVTNVGSDGGQSVKHLHFHVLAGRSLAWPPG